MTISHFLVFFTLLEPIFATSLLGTGGALHGFYSNTTSGVPSASTAIFPSLWNTKSVAATQRTTSLSSHKSSALVPGAVSTQPAVSVSSTTSGVPTITPVSSTEAPTTLVRSTRSTTAASSQVSANKVSVESALSSVFPGIRTWLEDTSTDDDTTIAGLDHIESDVKDLISETKADEDTNKGCSHSLFSLLGCIVISVTKIKSDIIGLTIDAVKTELSTLIALTSELPKVPDEEGQTDDDENEQSSSSSRSSSTSCTSTAVAEHLSVVCSPIFTSSGSLSSTTISCSTETSTVTGCSVSDYATSTTKTCSATSVTDTLVICQATITGSATTGTEGCITTTTVTTACEEVVSTTTASPYYRPGCAQTGCASCTDTSLPEAIAVCEDCTTIDGVPYPSQQTVLPSGAAEVTSLGDLSVNNDTSTRRKRSLPTPDEYGAEQFPYGAFFKAQLTLPEALHVPHRVLGTGGSSSALVYRFLTDSRLTMTLQGLYGCSSLILISRQGVYISHLFEDPGFARWDKSIPPQRIPSSFNEHIAQALPNGDDRPIAIGDAAVDGLGWLPSLNELSSAGGLLDPAQEGGVKAILVSPLPHPGEPGPYRYNDEINIIRDWVQQVFQTAPVDFIYTATDNEISNDANYAWGKVIFQYDPNEATIHEKFPIGGDQYTCPVQYAGLKLWIGYQEYIGGLIDPFYQDNWALSWDDSIAPKPYAITGLRLPNGDGSIAINARDELIPSACVKVDEETSSTTATSTSEQPTTTFPSGWVTSLPSIVTMIVTPSPVSITTEPLPSVVYVTPSPSPSPSGPTCWSEADKADYTPFDRAQALAAIDWFAGAGCHAYDSLTSGYGCILYHDPCLLELNQPRVDVVLSVEQMEQDGNATSYALDAEEMRKAILTIVDDCDTTTQHLKWGGWQIVESDDGGKRRYNISATTSEPPSAPPSEHFVGVPIERGATADECEAWDTAGE